MKTIYKYPIQLTGVEQKIELPRGSEVVNFVKKIDGLFLYAIVDPSEQETETRKFIVCGTGWPIRAESYKFIGSILLGEYEIYHLLEVGEKLKEGK